MRSFVRTATALCFLGLGVVAAGCDKKPEPAAADAGAATTAVKDAAAEVDASVAAAADAAAATAANAADAGAKHDMHNCPTSVPGATVAIKDVEGGVEVSITGKDEAATKEIRERTKKLADADKQDAGAHVRHDHSGSGGGTTGRCTIIMRNTKLETGELPSGSKVIVKAVDKTEVDWVRRETRERDKEAKSTSAEGAGTQRMAHCPSAVTGAKTTVKDTKEGVLVTVTGPKEALTDIRDRAKHAVEVAKKGDTAKPEHSGSGTGGGGLGRCPIVVEGDTTVAVKEIAEGVEVDVKTTKDVAALQKEAKARAANFTAK